MKLARAPERADDRGVRPLPFALAACALAAFLAWILRAPDAHDVAGVGIDAGRVETSSAPSDGLLEDGSEALREDPAAAIEPAPDRASMRTLAGASSGATTSEPSILGHASLRVLVVRDEDGEPFAGARVTLRAPGFGRRHGGSFDLTRSPPGATTDASGAARFDALESGSWTVIADAPGHAASEAKVSIRRSMEVPDLVLRLAVQRTIVVSLVDPAGRDLDAAACGLDPEQSTHVALELASACWSPAPVDARRSKAIERTGGEDAPFRWTVELLGRAPACVQVRLGDTILAAEMARPDIGELALRVRPAQFAALLAPIGVRVVSGDDERPVANALVLARGSGGRPGTSHRTDDDGRALVVPRFAKGPEIVVTVPGFATVHAPLQRPDGGDLVVRIGPGRRIVGVLRDELGAPVAQATIALHAVGADGAVASADTALVKSSREGRFRFEDVEPGAYAVGVSGAPRASASALPSGFVLVDCGAHDVVDVEIVRVTAPVAPKRAPKPRR